MKILAILQNTWVKDPARVKALFERLPTMRTRIIEQLLFAGSLTGKRIMNHFGDMIDAHDWTFEEASTVITGKASDCPPADLDHVAAMIVAYNPDVIVTFGIIARDAVREVLARMPSAECPHVVAIHPAARSGAEAGLKAASQSLRYQLSILEMKS